ncbi:hypothetical protein [Lacunimicrobium album]
MSTRPVVGHLFVTSLMLLFLSTLTGFLWLILHALRIPFAPFMGGFSITFLIAWLVVFIATFYLDLYHRLNKDDDAS